MMRMQALLIWQTISSAREQIINTSFGTMLLVIVACLIRLPLRLPDFQHHSSSTAAHAATGGLPLL